MRILHFICLAILVSIFSSKAHSTHWPEGKIAVSLSYDDALNSQLDNAVPQLNKYNFKASFYVVPASEPFQKRLLEWKALADQGHELGNHTLKHSCRGSLPNREWVNDERDLDKQSPEQLATEIKIANTLLQALDGQTQRTLTLPCGDTLAGGNNFVELVADEFIAIKGLESPRGISVTHVPSDVTGAQLIALITNNSEPTKIINLIFHGIGGDHLSVTPQAHEELLRFLVDNKEHYWVDNYLTIMTAKSH